MTSTVPVAQISAAQTAERAEPVRILVVDEQTIFRHGLRRLLRPVPD